MKNNVIKELSTSELQERLAVDKIQLNKMKINQLCRYDSQFPLRFRRPALGVSY